MKNKTVRLDEDNQLIIENDNAIIAQTSDYNLSEKNKDVFFSLENLCGEKVGINKLKEV